MRDRCSTTGYRVSSRSPISRLIQNAVTESLIDKFWDECLNEYWFGSLPEVQRIIETWCIHYDERRPYSSLGYLTPVQYAARGKR